MHQRVSFSSIAGWSSVIALTAACAVPESWDGSLVQYGTMHEAIGQQQHQGRVTLSDLAKPGFFGVAALEGLAGEVTIHDGHVIVTEGGPGGPSPVVDPAGDAQATLLVGAWVPSWRDHELAKTVDAGEFDRVIAVAAADAGIDPSRPFVFTAEGDFSDVRFHVINGACPVHARSHDVELGSEQRPFEGRLARVRGKLVGVFAEDAVGKLTHPGTTTHVHVVFEDEATGETVTGHVESVALDPGTVLRLPA